MYGLFTCLKYGFVSYLDCITSNLMSLTLSTVCSSSVWKIYAITFARLNRPPSL